MKIMKIMKSIVLFIWVSLTSLLFGQSITIATWNIEHLGSPGRGFPEYGENAFGNRTPEDFSKIASLIKDSLSFEVVAIQEVASSYKKKGKSYSTELTTLSEILGSNWTYYLANFADGGKSENEMQNAFLYDSEILELRVVFELNVPKIDIGGKAAFDRKPLIGYFIHKISGEGVVLVNLHLASGQDNDENHNAAMIIIEQNLPDELTKMGVSKEEKDIIILGDLNDNPFKKKNNGTCCAYSDLMYQYLKEKGYTHLINETFGTTRMSANLNSIIDHVFISKQAKNHVKQELATIYKPSNMTKENLKRWRSTYSDHFPIYFEFDVSTK